MAIDPRKEIVKILEDERREADQLLRQFQKFMAKVDDRLTAIAKIGDS